MFQILEPNGKLQLIHEIQKLQTFEVFCGMENDVKPVPGQGESAARLYDEFSKIMTRVRQQLLQRLCAGGLSSDCRVVENKTFPQPLAVKSCESLPPGFADS